MATNASAEMRYYAAAVSSLPDYPSAVNAGIVSDTSHLSSNTYHSGISDLPNPGGYTNRDWFDQMPAAERTDQATAVDTSMNLSDMIRQWNRYLAVFNDLSDPRRNYMAEYNGYNGVGNAERLDFIKFTRGSASADHKTHSHNARRRMYWNSRAATNAQLSIDRGETKQQYLVSIGQGPAAPTSGEDDDMMMFHATDDQGTQIVTDDQTVFLLVGSDLNVAIHKAQQNTANAMAGHPKGPGNSVGTTKAVWNDMMDWFDIAGYRFVQNADGTLGDWQE